MTGNTARLLNNHLGHEQDIGSANEYSKSLSYAVSDSAYHLLLDRTDSNKVDIWTFDEVNMKFIFLYHLDGANVRHFTLGYEHYILTTSPTVSRIYKWNEYEYILFQILDIEHVQHWEPILIPSSQDITLLFATTNYTSDPFALYCYSVADDKFLNNNIIGFPTCTLLSYYSYSFNIGTDVYIMILCDPYSIIQVLNYNLTEVVNSVVDQNEELIEEVEIMETLIERLHSAISNVSDTFYDKLTTNTNQFVDGTKYFENKVTTDDLIHVDSIFVSGSAIVPMENITETIDRLMNDHDEQVKSLMKIQDKIKDYLTLDTNQTVQVRINFENLISNAGAIVTNLNTTVVNYVDIEYLYQHALQHDIPDQVIEGTLYVDNVVFLADLEIVSDYFNSINISHDIFNVNSEQEIHSIFTLVGHVGINGNISGDTLLVNDIAISEVIVPLNGEHVHINGNITMLDNVIIHGNLEVDNFNRFNVTNYKHVLTKNKQQIVSGSITFSSTLKFDQDVEIGYVVNGMDLSELYRDVLKVFESNIITGNVTFLQNLDVFDDVIVYALTDGIDISDTLLTVSGDHEFVDSITIVGNFTMDCDVDIFGLLNGIDLSEDVVLLSGSQNITGNNVFMGEVISYDYIYATGNIDDVYMPDYYSRAMTIFSNQTLTGNYTFTEYVTLYTSYVDGYVNNVDILDLYLYSIFRNSSITQTIYGHVTFSQNVTMSTDGLLSIDSRINGFKVDEDILDVYSDQIITELKVLPGFYVASDMIVEQNVDTVYLEILARDVVTKYGNQTISGNKQFLGDMYFQYGNLYVAGYIDDVDLDKVLNINNPQVVTGLKTFHKLTIRHLEVLSNLNILNHLNYVFIDVLNNTRFTLNTDQTITGEIKFVDNVVIVENLDTFNCINLIEDIEVFAENVFSKTKSQIITGVKTIITHTKFDSDIFIADNATIDGIFMDNLKYDIWFLNETTVIDGVKNFTTVINVNGNITVYGEIQETNLTELFNDIVTDDQGPITIYGFKIYDCCVNFTKNVLSDNVSNIDISESFLLSHGAQNITGVFTFGNVTVLTNLDVYGLINDLDLQELSKSVLTTNTEQYIEGNVVILNHLHVSNDMIVNGSIHGVDWNEFLAGAVFKDEDIHFTGTTTLLGYTLSQNDFVFCPSKLNGIEHLEIFEQDIVRHNLIYIELTIKVHFLGEITVLGDMTLYGNLTTSTDLIYGLDIDEYLDRTLMSRGNQNITGFITFETIILKGNLIIDGEINNFDLMDLILLDTEDVIYGLKTFSNDVLFTSDIEVEGLFNSVNITNIVADTFYATSDQQLLLDKSFQNSVTITGSLDLVTTLNGIDIGTEVVKLDVLNQPIFGFKNFTGAMGIDGNIQLDGFLVDVNFTDLINHVITIHGSHSLDNAYFTGEVVFTRDTYIGGYIDDVDIDYLEAVFFKFFTRIQSDIDTLNVIASHQCQQIEELQDVYSYVVADLDHVETLQSWDILIRSFETFTTDSGEFYLLILVHSDRGEFCTNSYLYLWNVTALSFDLYDAFVTSGAVSADVLKTDDDSVIIAIASIAPDTCAQSTDFLMEFSGGLLSPSSTSITPPSLTNDVDLKKTDDGLLILFTGTDMETSTLIEAIPDVGMVPITVQEFPDVIAMSCSFLDVGNRTFVLFAERDFSTSRIYSAYLDNTIHLDSDPFTLFQEIATSNPLDITTFEHLGMIGFAMGNYGVLTADGNVDYDIYISVYSWSDNLNEFELLDSVPFSHTSDVDIFSIGPALYMLAVSQYSYVTIFKYKGTSAFQPVLQLDITGVVSCHSTKSPDGTMMLAFASEEPQHGSSVSYLMEAIFNGQVIIPIDGLCDAVLPSYHSDRSHVIHP
ncbi:uncharacterized protein [Antedon mediterranea]|uniref:uncharacterized protein n=1 Tax=Antedon mediterranea TaxID=105859 RepID=UPI003AF554CF